MEVILFNPEIPQNTGNIGRTCIAVGADLTLVRPLGFSLADKFLKRAGMDYWDRISLNVVDDLEEYLLLKYSVDEMIYLSTKGTKTYYQANLSLTHRCFIFGSEGHGLPIEILKKYEDQVYTIPMSSGTRSLNLATTVGIVLYEGLRQQTRMSIS